MIQAESVTVAPSFDKDHSFVVKKTENRILNKKGSAKDTRYFVVNISGGGPVCTCGDSRDIDPNNLGYVGQMHSALGFSYDESVNVPKVGEPLPPARSLSPQTFPNQVLKEVPSGPHARTQRKTLGMARKRRLLLRLWQCKAHGWRRGPITLTRFRATRRPQYKQKLNPISGT